MRLLVLGTGLMAGLQVERGWRKIDGVELVGAVDVDPGKLKAYAEKYNVPRQFGSFEAALDWGEFDAVTNVTPDALHHPTAMAVIRAGKHIFCEKPLATNYAHALEMADAAETAGLVNMVNLTYRNVAGLHAARALVEQGAIGEVKHIEASYLQHWLSLGNWMAPEFAGRYLWRLSKGHGSNGTMGDIGIHVLDFATFGASVEIAKLNCRMQTFRKVPDDRIGEYVLDANDSFVISAEFTNGAIGVIHSTRWGTGHANDLFLQVYGDKGAFQLSNGNAGSTLRVCIGDDRATATWRDIAADPVPTNYERFAEAVRTGVQQEPRFRHAAGLQKVLDLAMVGDIDRQEHRV